MTSLTRRPRTAPDPAASDPHRWMTLTMASVATLMVVLNVSIVNIALPRAQGDLGMSDTGRQWTRLRNLARYRKALKDSSAQV